jgi:hypothetical protein
MKSRILLLSLVASAAVLSWPAALRAEPWGLVSCPPEGEARWQAFEQAVRTAHPGSRVYVPKPYPVTSIQVIADYLYQYKSLQRDRRDPKTLNADEVPVLDGIMNSTVTYEVLRVENWTTMRCGTEKRRDSYYLVRVFDAASGIELTRAVIDYSGLFFVLVNMREDQRAENPALQRGRLPPPADAMAQADARFNIQGELPEYVTTYGSIHCHFAYPCLAFQQGGRSYILFQDEIFEIPAAGRRLTNGKNVGTPETNAALFATLAADEKLISLGGPAWTIAHKVDPRDLRRR